MSLRARIPRFRHPWVAIVVAACIAVLIGLRIALPFVVTRVANHEMETLPGLTGHVAAVHLHLWRGAASTRDVMLDKRHSAAPVPLFRARRVDVSIDWGTLLRHGHFVGRLDIVRPEVNITAEAPPRKEEMPFYKVAIDRFSKMVPIRIDSLRVIDATLHYRDDTGVPKVDAYLDHVDAVAHNLTNSRKVSKTLAATVVAEGRAMHSGQFKLGMKLDPFAHKPTFELAFELSGLSLPELNSAFEHYLAIRVEDGTLGFYAEATSHEGAFKGYVKPLLLDLKAVKLAPPEKSLGQEVKGVVAKIGAKLFENRTKKQLATRVELSGRFSDPQVDIWSAVGSFLKNAFIHAIAPGLEGTVDLREVGIARNVHATESSGGEQPKHVEETREAKKELTDLKKKEHAVHGRRGTR